MKTLTKEEIIFLLGCILREYDEDSKEHELVEKLLEYLQE